MGSEYLILGAKYAGSCTVFEPSGYHFIVLLLSEVMPGGMNGHETERIRSASRKRFAVFKSDAIFLSYSVCTHSEDSRFCNSFKYLVEGVWSDTISTTAVGHVLIPPENIGKPCTFSKDVFAVLNLGSMGQATAQ